MEATPAIERAVAALAPGARIVDVRAVTGGVSATVVRVDLEIAQRRRRVLFRQHGGAEFKQHARTVAEKECHLLAALHRAGLAVPEPLWFEPAGSDAAPSLVLDWVDGSTDVAAEGRAAALDQMADFLVRLHGLDPGALDVELEPVEDPVASVIPLLPASDAGRAALVRLTGDHVTPDPARRVVLHGDFWPGNVIWERGRLRAVIDWEDAALGDPLADLATARVELLCRFGDEAMKRFTTRYVAQHREQVGPLLLAALPVWELYVSAAALASMGAWGLDPDDEARRRRETERFFEMALAQLGQLASSPERRPRSPGVTTGLGRGRARGSRSP
jgi:aminoglycoside phosphotransferase (APT) family kinase protein